VKVVFDPEKISFEDLLRKFWEIHDPTQLNRQGPDIGAQYRSAIFFTTEEQKKIAEKSKRGIKGAVTEIRPAGKFYRAEEYHQDYNRKRGLSSCRI
jgi:methionine-S-sulfoxide reductase